MKLRQMWHIVAKYGDQKALPFSTRPESAYHDTVIYHCLKVLEAQACT